MASPRANTSFKIMGYLPVLILAALLAFTTPTHAIQQDALYTIESLSQILSVQSTLSSTAPQSHSLFFSHHNSAQNLVEKQNTTGLPAPIKVTTEFTTLADSENPTNIPEINNWDPLGYIPLKKTTQIDGFLLDIVVAGMSETTIVQDILLDTTGEYLTLFSQQACDGMTPKIANCTPELRGYGDTLSNITYYVDNQLITCTRCSTGTAGVGLLWAQSDGVLNSYIQTIDTVFTDTVQPNAGTPIVPAIYNLSGFRGILGLGQPKQTRRPIGDKYQRPIADLFTALTSQIPIDSTVTNQTTSFNYGLDLYLTSSNSTSQFMSNNTYYTVPYGVSTDNSTALNTYASKIWLNGVPPQYRQNMRWSPPQEYKFASSSSFLMYSLSMCDVPLYSSVFAIVDAMSPCLGVPQSLFDAIQSWVPLECDYAVAPETARQCYISTLNNTIPSLPTLNFALTGEANAKQLHLPLDQLLMPIDRSAGTNHTSSQRMCLTTSSGRGYVTIGSMPLSAMYYHVDYDTNRYGMANKIVDTQVNTQCLPRLQCYGQQSSYSAYNYCFKPQCGSYFLFSYNKNTQECDLNVGYPVALAIVVVIFVFLEAFFWWYEMNLEYNVTHTMPKMALVNRPRRDNNNNTAENDNETLSGATNDEVHATA